MSCILERNYDFTDCPKETSGGRQFLYLANLNEITAWTGVMGNEGAFSDFTLSGGSSLYKYEVSKNTLQLLEELQNADQDLGSYQQDANFMIKSLSVDTRNAINALNGIDLVAFVPLKNGQVHILGKDLGVRMVVNTADSNADAYGENVTLRATEMPEKRFLLIAGTPDQTIALLEGKITVS